MPADGGDTLPLQGDTSWEAAVGVGDKNPLFPSLDAERLCSENASLCSVESTVGREQSVPKVVKINT